MSEWVLVPLEQTNDMVIGPWHYVSPEAWRETLAARPPIPRDVWDAMLERGARATWESYAPIKGEWWTVQGDLKKDILRQFSNGLRAALGNPRVEGDEA